MTEDFKLQDPGEGVHEVNVHEVLLSPGDKVEEGQDVFVVESDKAAIDLPSPFSGVIKEIHVNAGDTVHVGETLMSVETEQPGVKSDQSKKSADHSAESSRNGEDRGESLPQHQLRQEQRMPRREQAQGQERESDQTGERDRKAEESTNSQEQQTNEGNEFEEPVKASPATRRVARELEIDLREVPPSGPKGRVTKDDVRAFAEEGRFAEDRKETDKEREGALPDFDRWGETERVELSALRRSMARRMARSWREIPHVTHQELADITDLEQLRQSLSEQVEKDGGRLTLTVFAIKAAASALKRFPRFNASFDSKSEELILKKYCNIGVALDSERGLIVPVVCDADKKSVLDIAIELKELSDRVRHDMPRQGELSGGTFTITNVGSIGGTGFSPIINYPQAAILGMGRARIEAVSKQKSLRRSEEAEFENRFMLPFCVTFDHRFIDGAEAARFAGDIKSTLSNVQNFVLKV